jgi:primosomal protein N' (replication factor Y)
VFGPAPAPLSRIRSQYRVRFLVRGGRNQLLQTYVRTWLGSVRAPAGIRIKVDVDPYSFL